MMEAIRLSEYVINVAKVLVNYVLPTTDGKCPTIEDGEGRLLFPVAFVESTAHVAGRPTDIETFEVLLPLVA